MRRTLGIVLLSMVGFFAYSQELQYPVIKNFGGVADFEKADKPTKPAKILVDLTSTNTTKQGINKGWEKVARLVNLYALSGIDMSDMEVLVIVHGGATKSILSDEAYQAKYNEANPDKEIIKAVQDAGVQVKVCSQAIVHRGFTNDGVSESVGFALSAITMLVEYQQNGFSVVYF